MLIITHKLSFQQLLHGCIFALLTLLVKEHDEGDAGELESLLQIPPIMSE